MSLLILHLLVKIWNGGDVAMGDINISTVVNFDGYSKKDGEDLSKDCSSSINLNMHQQSSAMNGRYI